MNKINKIKSDGLESDLDLRLAEHVRLPLQLLLVRAIVLLQSNRELQNKTEKRKHENIEKCVTLHWISTIFRKFTS